MSNKPNWKKKLPTLSVCMIVRNEEANLERCLRSVAAVADEIIIVDTGSTDRSMEIARQYGAKIYEHPWEDNFSLHRNQSLEYATKDWILMIDGDEELVFQHGLTPKDFKRFLRDFPRECDVISTQLLDIRYDKLVARHNTSRIHRRGVGHFEGIVHNRWVSSSKAGFSPQIAFKHYGYEIDSEVRKAKLDRTERLLLKQLDMPGENLHTYFYLTQIAGMRGEIEKCVEYGEKYWARHTKNDEVGRSFFGSIHFTIAANYKKLGDKVKTLEWIHQGLEIFPGDPDLCMALSDYGVWIEDNEVVVSGAKGFIKAYTTTPTAQTGSHHTFTMFPDTFAVALYRMTVIRMHQMAQNWRAFKEALPDMIDEGLRDKLMADTLANARDIHVADIAGGVDSSIFDAILQNDKDLYKIEAQEAFL